MNRTNETATAKFLDQALIYLSLFDRIDVPPSVGELRRCLPGFDSQIVAIGTNDYRLRTPTFDKMIDKVASEVGLLNGNMIFAPLPEDTRMEMDLVSVRELWGSAKSQTMQLLNIRKDMRITEVNDRLIDVIDIPIDKNGVSYNIDRTILKLARNRLWHTEERMEAPENKDRNIGFICAASMITAFQVVRKKSWYVDIGFSNKSASIAFLTDPTGVKAMFTLRDIPDHAKRREALLHWVSEHWRQNRYDPEVEIYVRSHLRGQSQFSWFGMNVTIVIPPSDIEKAHALKLKRQLMKLEGKDRRPRA